MKFQHKSNTNLSLVILRYNYFFLFFIGCFTVLLPMQPLYAAKCSKPPSPVIPVAADVLPLRLITFHGNVHKDIVFLTWTTSSEKNVNRFEAEKSADGINFSSISKQTAVGVNASHENYLAEDFKPKAGVNYYRLKVIGNDNKVFHSRVIKIKHK